MAILHKKLYYLVGMFYHKGGVFRWRNPMYLTSRTNEMRRY